MPAARRAALRPIVSFIRSRKLHLATIFALVLLLLVTVTSTPVLTWAQAAGATITVRGKADTNDRTDGMLTLREAILLSEGTLKLKDLSADEKKDVKGTPGQDRADTIDLDTVIVLLTDALPEINDADTTIRGVRTGTTLVDGANKVAVGLVVKKLPFHMTNVEWAEFTEQGVKVDTSAGGKLSVRKCEFKFTKQGLVISAIGRGKLDLDIVENKFTDISGVGLQLTGEIGGAYNITKNTIELTSAEVGAKLRLGNGLGNIKVTYKANTHTTTSGNGSVFEELQHQGQIEWDVLNNAWFNNKTGIEYTFRLLGNKNFSNNTYSGNVVAGAKLIAEPVEGVKLKVSARNDTYFDNMVGWRQELNGRIELSTEFLRVLNDTVGIEGFVALNGAGSWRDRHSTYTGNVQVGIRVLSLSDTVVFDLFYEHDFVSGNGRGLEYDLFRRSVHIDHSTIVSNNTEGIVISRSRAVIRTSLICFNGTDGINITGDSTVEATRDIIDKNGQFELRNLSPNSVDATRNDWGPATASEMESKPYPSNISRIFDVFDEPGRGFAAYANWVRSNVAVGCGRQPPPTPSETPSMTPTNSVTPTRTVTTTAPTTSRRGTPVVGR